ncbi:MAG TPA: ABC-ATPase UvrA, partial [Myxococcota bacterium]|nr:ABC-ATPase UvrA [Myxococcota bacterium]
ARYEKHTIELVIDRLVLSLSDRPRLVEGIERAVKLSKGLVSTLIGEDYALHAVERSCPDHGISVPELEPRLFSFNAPQGACPSCGGLGLKTTDESTFLRPVYTICTACNGRRLNPIALAVRFRQYTIDQMVHLPVEDARRFFDGLRLDEREQRIGETLLKEIQDRLRFLDEVGLGYLNLDRRSNSLSGGEAQRIRLAACVGSRLQGVTYVLDEPSIGLHPRDNGRLIDALFALRDVGNTVVVVEHDRETMERADHIVDIGPGAGRFGGRLTGQGDPAHFVVQDTPTARFLRDEQTIALPTQRRSGIGRMLRLEGAKLNNLQDLTVEFPLGTLTVLTGVSGSGKSTLMTEELEPRVQKVLAAKRGEEEKEAIKWKIPGAEQLDKLIEIDQQPIGRTPRSNPATYSGAFDLIRDLFAASPEA